MFDHKIIFTGTVDECVALEARMRPRKGIGWNRAPGGKEPWFDYKHNAETRAKLSIAASKRKREPHSLETRAKMSAAAFRRYADPDQYAATIAHLKSLTFDRSGAANGHFGKPHSEATKQKMRELKQRSVCKHGHQKPPGKPCRECQRMYMRGYNERRKLRNPALRVSHE